MDSNLRDQSPDISDMKPSFRKLSNDTVNRKYRRRSPISGSSSSSSDGSPNYEHGRSPNYSKDASYKMKRKDEGKDFGKDSDYPRSGKASDSYRHSDKQSRGSSFDYYRHDSSRHHRHARDEDRGYQKTPRSGWESRGSSRSDHVRNESDYERYRDSKRNSERYPQERSDDRSHKRKEREPSALEHHRYSEKDLSSDKYSSRRQGNSSFDDVRASEHERSKDGGGRDDRRDHQRSSGDYRIDKSSSQQDFRQNKRDLNAARGSGSSRLKESHRSNNEESVRSKEVIPQKRKQDDWENGSSSSTHREGTSTSEKPLPCSKQVDAKLASGSGTVPSSTNESSEDLNAAKVAAMKAAELVNKNLAGGMYMSTDQKKKLLWGNKKNTTTEESNNHWNGMAMFMDRERQEKFNKLMGVKGDLKLPLQSEDKGGSSQLQAEKQEQLQLDLEKQYTAGLRRRDGRTVGLGL